MAKKGIPGSCTGYTWGTSVAVRNPAFSAARAGAIVRMSLTTTSGRNSSISGTRASAASAADVCSSEPGAGGGKVLYSSAAVNPRPSPSTASRQRSQVSTSASWPRRRSARARAMAGNAWPASPKAATRNRRELTETPAPRGGRKAGRSRYTPSCSPGRMKTISGTRHAGEVRSRNRTDSAMSSGRIMSSAFTWPFANSVIGVSTNAGHSAVT